MVSEVPEMLRNRRDKIRTNQDWEPDDILVKGNETNRRAGFFKET